MTTEELKTFSEIVRNFVEILGILGGGFALSKWIVERRDRSTQVIFDLATRFDTEPVRIGRTLVEDDRKYQEIRSLLLAEAVPEEDDIPGSRTVRVTHSWPEIMVISSVN